ncbi:nucleotide exchange factor GrpE [Wigglesworthia glossinidia]|uniref:nucleotide exchange factor GrpE n=1 Tax=Wigglesworthia glossinidia TaxID=51229 RepID=UPI002E806B63|nr:nucleotide exchange factor GrpE [Wigglesworthia glossinidia]
MIKKDILAEKKQSIEKEKEILKKNEIIFELEEKISKMKKMHHDQILRNKAEIENILKRTQLNIEKSHKFSLEKFSIALLPIIDNLERTLEVSNKLNTDIKPIIEGIKLTLQEFTKVMQSFNITCIDKINVVFDPKIHEAMTVLDTQEFQPNQVMQIMQKGYMLHDRLLRPAMVAVSK